MSDKRLFFSRPTFITSKKFLMVYMYLVFCTSEKNFLAAEEEGGKKEERRKTFGFELFGIKMCSILL